MNKILSMCAAILIVASAAHAQERTAGSAMEAQMNWTAMKQLVDNANNTSAAVSIRVEQIVKCNKILKLYAPGNEGADADGCIDLPFVKETEYVESAGWQRPSYTLACTKGRKISYAMVNVSTNPNQLACGRTGANCDGNATSSLVGKAKWDVQVDPGKYVSAFIECK